MLKDYRHMRKIVYITIFSLQEHLSLAKANEQLYFFRTLLPRVLGSIAIPEQ